MFIYWGMCAIFLATYPRKKKQGSIICCRAYKINNDKDMRKITKKDFTPFSEILKEDMKNPKFKKAFEEEVKRLSLPAEIRRRNIIAGDTIASSQKIPALG